jgi:hypothetical protein
VRWFAAEIIVVVAGVLIAFAVNAWWSERLERARVAATLENVAAEIEANIGEIRGSVEYNRHRAAILGWFLQRTPDEFRALPADSMRRMHWAMRRPFGYDPGGGALDGLLGGADFAAVRDPDLRARLVAWRRLPDEVDDDFDETNAAFQNLTRQLVRHGVFQSYRNESLPEVNVAGGRPIADAFAALREDSEAVDGILLYRLLLWDYADELEEFVPLGDSLVQRLTAGAP